MGKFIISGENRLEGEVRVGAAKNAVLPILAATIINGKQNILYDCPVLRDVDSMIKILKALGCKVHNEGSALIVDSSTLSSHEVPEHLVREMRSSIFLMGPMLVRCGKVRISYPGGCDNILEYEGTRLWPQCEKAD
ncbi:MAG TPA: UDP-N-acetylglucosamine 1-carboxyvinyltransferase [Clostridiales bacterium]|nr:UDP-N-acetylglucosamine 1-carboxyvinyltransferase [Clostridiales bacterium]